MSMTRRAILTGVPALAASSAVPIGLAAGRAEEDPHAHARLLLEELAGIMPAVMNGRFRAMADPDGWYGFQAIGTTTDHQLLFEQGVALRRLLIVTDGRTSAARYAKGILMQTDAALEHRWRRI